MDSNFPASDNLPNTMPLDQAQGLRRLFAHTQVVHVPVVSNPNVAFSGVMLERLCAGFSEQGRRTLVIDAAERAGEPSEMALLDLAECIEPLSAQVWYLAARGLPLRFVDASGSTAPFLDKVMQAAPQCDVLVVHAPATDLCRLFARRRTGHNAVHTDGQLEVRPLLLADDRPASVTHAYAAMKLLTQRAGLVVHDLLLGAAPHSPRAERIAMQLATCADDFLGAVLHDWVQLDPASHATEPPTPALRRLVRELLRAASGGLHATPLPPERSPAMPLRPIAPMSPMSPMPFHPSAAPSAGTAATWATH